MINVIGNMFGSSGYANHMRGLVNELNKLTPCKILTNLIPGFESLVNDAELAMIKREQDYDINLVITHPLHWKSNMGAKRNWVYLIWEGDKIPYWIMQECLNPDIEKIIVPSTHTYQALRKGFEEYDPDALLLIDDEAIKKKVVVIPHGVDTLKFYPKKKIVVDNLNNQSMIPFKFLANKGLRNMEDRGGIQYLIKAYLEEFTEAENVELILKINPAYGVPNLLLMFPELLKPGPTVRYNYEDLTQDKLNDLYNECDVFVSPTRAEAFNLPVLEAAVCKKPSITTGYGGQTDFITNENGWLINYILSPVTHEIEYEEVNWATPDLTHLKMLLRYAYTHQDEVKEKGEKAYLLRNLTWGNSAQHIERLI